MKINNKGFSLISVMVAAGLLGGLSLGVMQLIKNMSNTQTFSQSSTDYIDLSQEVSLLVSSPEDCTASFKGVSFKGSNIQGTPVDVELWSADQDGNRSRLRFSGNSDFGKLQIDAIRLSMPDYTGGDFPQGSGQSFNALLEIVGKKQITSNQDRDIKAISKSFKLYFDTDSGGNSTITGCTAASSPSSGGDVVLDSCSWSGYVNNYDGPVNYTCPGDKVISGVRSVHSNGTEDRRFEYKCCRASVSGTALVKKYCLFSGDVNNKDNLVNYTCSPPLVYGGVQSNHDSGTEDRSFSFQCCDMKLTESAEIKDCEISGYVNIFDGAVDYTCPINKILVGEMSYHDGGFEDRRFRYKCCSLLAR